MKKGVTIFLCAFLLVIVVICIKVNTLDETISDNVSEEETVSNNESIEIIYLDLPEQIIQDSFSEENQQTVSDNESVFEENQQTVSDNESVTEEMYIEVAYKYLAGELVLEDWQDAYLDFLINGNDIFKPREEYEYSLIYLDDNEVPELFIQTDCHAGGELIATYYNGELVVHNFARLGSEYIERSGLVYTDTGHMDWYPVIITKLENGVFNEIGAGVYYLSEEEHEKMMAGEPFDYILSYKWEDTIVSEEVFYEKIAELYDLENSIYPSELCTYEDIMNQIINTDT